MTLTLCALGLAIVGSGCEREQRTLDTPPSQATTVLSAQRTQPSFGAAQPASQSLAVRYEKNAYAVTQGKRLYDLYNCSGCHAQGGGGSGPALTDDVWIYGANPETIFASIAQGRPNGMPSFGRRIPEYQIWQLVTYVRSMTGLISTDAAPGRNDAMQAKPSEQLADRQPPRLPGSTLTPEQPK